jgi:hypothetical protein
MTRGVLVQLFAYGASDVDLFGNTTTPYCYNDKDYMYKYFVESSDGFPNREDIKSVLELPGILDHVPANMKPQSIEETYDIKFEPKLDQKNVHNLLFVGSNSPKETENNRCK